MRCQGGSRCRLLFWRSGSDGIAIDVADIAVGAELMGSEEVVGFPQVHYTATDTTQRPCCLATQTSPMGRKGSFRDCGHKVILAIVRDSNVSMMMTRSMIL